MTSSLQNDIVDKYLTKGRPKLHLSFYTTPGDFSTDSKPKIQNSEKTHVICLLPAGKYLEI